MRLTLRTLLAYLDDILEPSQTKEIGNKLTESKFASDLVERIREVMRRRRLAAPDVDSKDGGLDANVMAEYLDNTLPADKVTDVEKHCLESDMHLAEAAASHQILTLVLGEPVEISPESRRRMYGLVSQGSGDDQAAVAASEPRPSERQVESADELAVIPSASATTAAATSGLPDYLKPRPFFRRAAVVVGFLALIGLFLALSDPGYKWLERLFGRTDAQTAATEKLAAPGQLEPNEGAAAGSATGQPGGMSAKGPDVADHGSATGSKEIAKGSTPLMPELSPDKASESTAASPIQRPGGIPKTTAPSSVGTTTTPAAEKNAKSGNLAGSSVAATTSTLGNVQAPSNLSAAGVSTGASAPGLTLPVSGLAGSGTKQPTPQTTVAALPAPEVRLTSQTGILLGYDPGRDDWFVVGRPGLTLPKPADLAEPAVADPAPVSGSPIRGKGGKTSSAPDPSAKIQVPTPPVPLPSQQRADQLAAPEPFDSQLEFGDKLCRVWLLGGTSVRLLEPRGSSRFGIELREGKVVIRSGAKPPDGEYRPLVMQVAPRSARDEIWQLELLRPETQCGLELVPGFPDKPGEDASQTGYRGGLYVLTGEVRFTEPAGRQRTLAAGWAISLAPADRALAADFQGQALKPRGASVPPWLNPESRRIPAALSRSMHDFELEFLPDQAVSLSLSTTATSDQARLSEWAVKTLALTNQYPALVEVLTKVSYEESVRAAINGLRAWLPLAPDRAGLLQTELASSFVPEEQRIVMRLLWGYNRDDARDLVTSKQLVDWLDSDKLAIRIMAFDQIRELTGQTKNYRPSAPVNQRKGAKKEWDSYVKRTKGLLRR